MAEYTFKLATVEPTITYVATPVISAGENSLDCLVSKQASPQHENLTGATYEYSSQVAGLPFLPAASLATAPLWLVFYECSFGGGPLAFGGAAIPQVEVMSNRGGINPPSSDKTYGGGEGSGLSTQTPESSRCNWMGGAFLFVPDGTDLEFRMRTTAGPPRTTFYSGMSLFALPVDVSPHSKRLHYAAGGDLYGAQMALTGDPNVVVPTGTSWAPIFETTQTFPSGNYLVIASCQGDTVNNNGIQMRFSIDGAVQKSPVTRVTDADRDDIPFFFSSIGTLNGSHTFTLEGGSITGAANKVFRKARIWIIDLNKFERWGSIRSDAPLVLDSIRFPTWNTATSLRRTIVPFSTSGEYVLSLGTSYVNRTTQAGMLSRIYNTTLANSAHEHNAAAQVKFGGNDVCVLGNVGCELSNISTDYELQHCGSSGGGDGDLTVSYRELILLGLTKKPGAAPPTVSIFISDSCTTNETQSTPTGSIGVANLIDSCGTADFLSMIGDAPPAGIPNVHPRLWLTNDRLTYLRAQAAANSAGWQDFLARFARQDYALWNYALKYVVTQNPADLTAALAQLDEVCNGDLNGSDESNGLRFGLRQRQACFYYDWLYHDLTPAQRTKLQDYILGLMYFVLNNGSGVYTPGIIWSRNDPSNNYFMSWHQIGMYGALTLYHDVWPNNPSPSFAWPPGSGQSIRSWWLPLRHGQTSGQTFTDGYEYITARLEQIALPMWRTVGPGGLIGGSWHEGSWYRPMWIMFECFRVIMETAGYVPDIGAVDFRDFGWWTIYSQMPGARRHPEYGDSGTAELRKEIGPNDRTLLLYVIDKYRGEPIASYCQYFLSQVIPATSGSGLTDYSYDGFDFFLGDARIPATDYNGLIPKYWFAASSQTLVSRTGFGPLDTAVFLHSQDRLQTHEHGQNNDFQILSGRGGSNWDARVVVGPRCAHGPAGENQASDWRSREHCTHTIAGTDQRYSGEVIASYQPDLIPSGSLPLWSGNPTFVYGRAEAHDAYRLGVDNYSVTMHPNKRCINYFWREMVHLVGPNIAVLYDRVQLRQTTPDGTAVPQTDESHFHYPDPGPIVTGNVLTLTVGTAKVYKKNLLPEGQLSTIVDETNESPTPISFPYNCVDEVINLPVVNNFSQHLLAFEVESTASAGVSPISHWDGNNGIPSTTHVGATIDKGGVRYHVGFTRNQTGAEPANPFTYYVQKSNDNDVHAITGLVPGQLYFVEETVFPVVMEYRFTKAGIGFPADKGGCVMFSPSQLGDQSTAVIFLVDGCIATETTNLVETKYISVPLDSCTNVERTTLITDYQAIINVLDTCTGAEVVGLTPQFNGGIYDSCSSIETVTMVATGGSGVPAFEWSEKVIEVGSEPLRPSADREVSFFGMDPQDGSVYDKLADDDDSTHVYTFGANATNAYLDLGLTAPGVYVGRIRLIQPVIRVLSCELGGSSGANVSFSLSGLGLQVLTQTFRVQQIFTTGTAVDLVFDPISVNIEYPDFPLMGMRIDVSGNPIGNNFVLKLSRAYINILSSSTTEKVIS